jgi:hypothetical protein
LQTRALDHWSDGSVRWLLLDFQTTGSGTYRLQPGPPLSPNHTLKIHSTDQTIQVDTGPASFILRHDGPLPFAQVFLGRDPVLDGQKSGLRLIGSTGEGFVPKVTALNIEDDGPLRASLVAKGEFLDSRGNSVLSFEMEYHFYSGWPTIRCHYTLRNPRAAKHPGGLWNLGDPGSILLREASIDFAVKSTNSFFSLHASPELPHDLSRFNLPFELYQESSGGTNWQSTNHLNRNHEIPQGFQGYRIRHGQEEIRGLRATPIVSFGDAAATISVVVPKFWQNFPRAIEAKANVLTLELLPRQFADYHELQGGEQKTHIFYVNFARGGQTVDLEWCRTTSVPVSEPTWYAEAQAVPYLLPQDDDPDAGYARLVGQALDGANTFEHKREAIDEYGWRHFGDIYGDHEGVFHKGAKPLVSHYNNQYDAIQGFAIQLFRTADRRWFEHMDELAWHVIDIDIYHTDEDKSAYNHGLFWHTVHYVDADTSTHRTYPKAGQVSGGGPANEHNYTTGLMLHYFLTGNRASRTAALELAQWVIDMDDGRKTIFRWLAGGPSGLASQSRTPDYHGPGRGSANSLSVLLDGHRLSRDVKYLHKAEEIIRRVIHPEDNIQSRNLLDAENRWFYTMFLQALGKYLDYKAELGQLDDMYAYARAALLHYARWMVDHEYPYLEKPEILEFPTETWAAQDMRKSEIFWYARLHSEDEGERARFQERARYFFNYSIRTLETMPTKHLCRPVVLLLSHGYRQAWFERYLEACAPKPTIEPRSFGKPITFEPQKRRAIRRFKRLVLVGGALAMLSLAIGLTAIILRLL